MKAKVTRAPDLALCAGLRVAITTIQQILADPEIKLPFWWNFGLGIAVTALTGVEAGLCREQEDEPTFV